MFLKCHYFDVDVKKKKMRRDILMKKKILDLKNYAKLMYLLYFNSGKVVLLFLSHLL